jgi:hypothetical protein
MSECFEVEIRDGGRWVGYGPQGVVFPWPSQDKAYEIADIQQGHEARVVRVLSNGERQVLPTEWIEVERWRVDDFGFPGWAPLMVEADGRAKTVRLDQALADRVAELEIESGRRARIVRVAIGGKREVVT